MPGHTAQFLDNTAQEFQEWARRDRNSPSVVIWDVENEMLRVSYDLHLPWVEKLPAFIEALDDTRPFNNSGQGWFGPDQDIHHRHVRYCLHKCRVVDEEIMRRLVDAADHLSLALAEPGKLARLEI